MKLNTKFSLIVAATVVFIFVQTICTFFWNKKNMAIKDYQYKQIMVQKDLSELINYINQLDFHQVMAATAHRDYSEKLEAVETSMLQLTESEIVKTFPQKFQDTLAQLQKLWDINKKRYEKLLPVMEEIEGENLPLTMYTNVQKAGIRDSYEKYPDNEQIQHLFECVEKVDGEFSGILSGYTTLTKLNRQTSYEFEDILESANRRYSIYSFILSLITSLLLATSITMVTFKIARRIILVRDMSKNLAKKDFTVSVESKGASGEMQDLMLNMNSMVSELNDFLLVVKKTASKAISSGYQINDSANSTAAATTQIDANIESITKEFDQISQSVENAVKIIAEMNRQVDNLVHYNSRQTEAVSDANRTVAEIARSLENMTKMAAERSRSAWEMNQLVEDGDAKITLTAKKLEEMKDQLKAISGIVKIINDIASQTNLLSMNAAIESAHAGEAGMGFAVVAGEIRGLAENTSANAKRIKEAIEEIVKTVNGANEASIQASTAFGKVRANANDVVQSLQEISNGIQGIDSQMQVIRDKTEVTAQAANEINGYSNRLAESQKTVSEEVSSMNNRFAQAQNGIHEIKRGTTDIVNRINEVSENSKDSYKNMTDLENILEEFKTKGSVNEALAAEDQANSVDVEAEKLAEKVMSMAEQVLVPQDHEIIEFNLDDVEEI